MRIQTRFVTGPFYQVYNDKLGIYYPSFEEEKERIKTFQELALRRQRMKYSFSTLQTHLFQSMMIEQQFLKSIKENPLRDAPEEVQQAILEVAKFPLYAMRNIADGMAFRFLDYNMPLMQTLGSQANGVEELCSEGIFHESEFFSRLTDSTPPDVQVFMCSLCDLVGIGDIIIKSKDEFEFLEVKKNKHRGSRISRQKERMKSLEDFFNSKEETIEGNRIQLISFPCRKSHCADLDGAISDCLSRKTSKFQISDYQLVYCFDTKQDQNSLRNQIDEAYDDAERVFGHRVFPCVSSKYMHWTGMTVPFSVFPISPGNLAELLLGGVFFISFISLDAFERHITGKGWKYVDLMKLEASDKHFSCPIYLCVDPNNTDCNFTIPVDYMLDCGLNFIDLDCLLDNGISLPRSKTGMFSVYYEGENKIWV